MAIREESKCGEVRKAHMDTLSDVKITMLTPSYKMKTYSYFSAIMVIILVAGLPASCIKEEDPCDGTVKPEISVSLKATVHVLDKDHNPIPNEQLTLYIYKIPCGASSTGKFDYSGPTNAYGIKETSVVSYNLRNADDKVYVDAYAPNLGNGSASANSEYGIYAYDDFIPGSTKEVHLYLYRNH